MQTAFVIDNLRWKKSDTSETLGPSKFTMMDDGIYTLINLL